jgi:uncharacterized membrane protein YccC
MNTIAAALGVLLSQWLWRLSERRTREEAMREWMRRNRSFNRWYRRGQWLGRLVGRLTIKTA